MSDDDLREALRLMSEPGTPPPGAGDRIHAGVRRRRQRRATLGVSVAAATVLAGVAIPLLVDLDHPARDDSTPITAPYEAEPCPEQLPDLVDANHRLPDLDQVVAVQICTDARDFTSTQDPPRALDLAWPATEALVTGLDQLASAVEALPAVKGDRCATIDVISSRTSLTFDLADGSRVLVPTFMCADLVAGGRKVSAADVANAFLDGLDRQRDEFDYGRTVDIAPTCDTVGHTGPVQPGRERLVAAVLCSPRGKGSGVALDPQQVELLQERWERAGPPTDEHDNGTEDPCLDLEQAPSTVRVVTDRGDLVGMFESPCGYLVLDGERPASGRRCR